MDRIECADDDQGVRVSEPIPVSTGAIRDFVDGYLVPVDPMDDLRCDSCQ